MLGFGAIRNPRNRQPPSNNGPAVAGKNVKGVEVQQMLQLVWHAVLDGWRVKVRRPAFHVSCFLLLTRVEPANRYGCIRPPPPAVYACYGRGVVRECKQTKGSYHHLPILSIYLDSTASVANGGVFL